MRIVVVGGTSSIAEHCCRQWVEREDVDIELLVRDAGRGERIAADLRTRNPRATIGVTETGFVDPAAIDDAVARLWDAAPVDLALIAHGWLPPQANCQDDLATCREVIEVNAVSPALFAEAFAARFAGAGRGTLVLLGSVAGDRGRKANYSYGAAKGFVERYAEGMQHRFARTGVRVVLAKPGPTDTPMAGPAKAQGRRVAAVQDVARAIVRGIDRGRPVIYAPWYWRAIMLVIRHIPRPLFNRLEI